MNHLPKPQLKFVPKVDNSYFQFVPTIQVKENAITPIPEVIIKLQSDQVEYMKENPEIVFNPDTLIPYTKVSHPYEEEITNLKPDWKKLLKEISYLNPTFPPPVQEREYDFIDKPEQLEGFMEEISKCRDIAVDLEFHAYRSYQGFT